MRIAIVNDVAMTLEMLRRMVSKMPGHEVIWLARSGTEAIAKCKEDRPDIILMDLVMPGINGVEATRQIMLQYACAILVVTASVKGNQRLAFEALSAGAVDIVQTPSFDADGESGFDDQLQRKINNISQIVEYKYKQARKSEKSRRTDQDGNGASEKDLLVAIGASTGGPAAVVEVLNKLPANFPAAVIVVVHVDSAFAFGMAQWISGMVKMPVHIAREGEHPRAGEVLVAASNDHLILGSQQKLQYTSEPLDYPYRPSVDVFFSSLVQSWRGEAIGVLLTGMGRDGAKGLKKMREHGWQTIAQDEKSSAIYGMPKEAAKIGAASEILPLGSIGAKLIRYIGKVRETVRQ